MTVDSIKAGRSAYGSAYVVFLKGTAFFLQSGALHLARTKAEFLLNDSARLIAHYGQQGTGNV
ncbi:MAG: hypothetical protein ACOYOT_08835 [Bacteroidales bacterium]